MNTSVIVQARMGSTRLPNKILLPLVDKNMVEHVLERAKLIKGVQKVILATTTLEEDNVLETIALNTGVHIYRGSADNVLDRYYQAAKIHEVDHIIRITADCPLIDPFLSSELLEIYFNHSYDYAHLKGFPRGLDTEVFSYETLFQCIQNANEKYQTEHVTPYIYENSDKFNVYDLESEIDYSQLRWTVDTKEDYKAIQTIHNLLSRHVKPYAWESILEIINKHPEIQKINQHILQKKLGD